MKDYADSFLMNACKMGKIHGHTRIVLRNPISGNILKDVESENTFQPTVLQNYTFGMGDNLHSIPSFNWDDIVGGIFLFRYSVTAGSVYMPSNNYMIGNSAVGITNAAAPNELGSYNDAEKSIGTSAITQVYDFNTSQANGTISSVCLTSKIGGQIGYGNVSGRRTDVLLSTGQSGQIGIGGNQTIVNNMIYSFSIDGNNLIVEKTRRSITQGTIFRGLSSTSTISLATIKPSGSTLSTEIVAFALNNNKIRLYTPLAARYESADHVYFFDYDPSNDTVELGDFQNSAGKTILGGIQYITFLPDNYCATYDTDRYLQVFDVDDSTHVMDYTTEQLYGLGRAGNYNLSLSDGLMVNYNTGAGYMVNYINNTVRPINVGPVYSYAAYNKRYPSVDGIGFTTDNNYPKLIKNPLYLATINNITPVTKDQSMTMKVSYTLNAEV